MHEIERIYNTINLTAKEMFLKIHKDDSEKFDNNFGMEIYIKINEQTVVKFFKFNNFDLVSTVIVNGEEYNFDLEDYRQYDILEINHNYVNDVKLDNFITTLQRKLGYIPKGYVAPTRHTFRNGKLIR